VTGVMALIGNVVIGEGLNVAEWSEQNLAVVPMIVFALAAMVFRRKLIQIAAPAALMAVWATYFTMLQSALR
jgi:hypothetical protein